ncbi:MAG: CDP-alcohol phosphatidyltransferase family protein [Rhodospirillaceae bacterium]
MNAPPYDQRLARVLVRPLQHTFVRPNHITTLTLLMALAGGLLFTFNETAFAYWGAGIFVLSRFLDHFDGELARLQGSSSKFGYYYDYAVGGIGYAALFAGLGIGHYQTDLGVWALALGGAGAASALISLFSNMGIDQELDTADSGEAIGYPGFAGFELEDGIYLLVPVTWLGYITPFFIAAGIGASIYCLWSIGHWLVLSRRNSAS